MKAHEWLDLGVAAVELAIARAKLKRTPVGKMLGDDECANSLPSAADIARVDRVRVAVARMSHRVPWRSDCLVQAMAARRWLARHGVRTKLSLGVPTAAGPDFEAHAWLTHGGRAVTGGDVGGHVALIAAASQDAKRAR